jgi:prevent-host-death family protein
MDNSNQKGNVAELAIATEAARLGLSVLKPLTEHERYDLVIGIDGRLLRVQCKWASLHGEVVKVRFGSCYHSPTRGYVKTTYGADKVDAIAAYCHDLGRCYFLLIENFAGKNGVHLRVGPARNNQRASLHWAADYEFPGAVAQLEERRHGMAEVRGSSPLSSTADISAPPDRVGAHEFRNRFGYYLERAAAGAEISISRHGRPYARLVAPVRPDADDGLRRRPHKIACS